MNIISIALALGTLLCPSVIDRALSAVGAANAPAALVGPSVVAGKDWIAKVTDNICGLRDPAQLSNPATVDFQACLDATPEMRKAKQDKVGLDTPEGIRLLNDATNRVTVACESVRSGNGYCSIWKAIKHKDGRAVADVTELVKAQY